MIIVLFVWEDNNFGKYLYRRFLDRFYPADAVLKGSLNASKRRGFNISILEILGFTREELIKYEGDFRSSLL